MVHNQSENILKVSNLTVSYKQHAVKARALFDVSFSMKEARFVVSLENQDVESQLSHCHSSAIFRPMLVSNMDK
jgi:hypothetical protein